MPLSPEKYLSYLAGIAVSLGLFSATLLVFGYNPVLSLETIATGSFATVFDVSETLVQTTPLLLCALAFLVPFKARFYNIGVEGQLYFGALTAYLAASQLGSMPSALAILLVGLAALLGGTLWLGLPLLLRLKLQVNEIFPTLVLNFVATDLVNWLTAGPLKDPMAVNPQTPVIPMSTWLPVLIPGTRLSAGLIIALVAAAGVFIIVYKTVLGYEIKASGSNPKAAREGGVDINRSIIAVGLLSGGLAGLAGMIPITSGNHYLVQNFSPGYGYQGIGVATLGAFHPIGAILASVLYSALLIGGESMQRLQGRAAVPIELIYVLQVTIVLTVLIVQKVLSDRRRY